MRPSPSRRHVRSRRRSVDRAQQLSGLLPRPGERRFDARRRHGQDDGVGVRRLVVAAGRRDGAAKAPLGDGDGVDADGRRLAEHRRRLERLEHGDGGSPPASSSRSGSHADDPNPTTATPGGAASGAAPSSSAGWSRKGAGSGGAGAGAGGPPGGSSSAGGAAPSRAANSTTAAAATGSKANGS